jgi:hypothetical protein
LGCDVVHAICVIVVVIIVVVVAVDVTGCATAIAAWRDERHDSNRRRPNGKRRDVAR